MSDNTLFAGFSWREVFIFSEDFFEDGDLLRMDFKKSMSGETVFRLTEANDGGIRRDGKRVHVTVSKEQSALLSPPRVVTNFVLRRAGEDIPIDALITIPVAISVTEPQL